MKKIGVVLNDGSREIKIPDTYGFVIERVTEERTCDDIAADFVKQKFDVIVGAGGDGTLNTVAKHLIDTEILFGILPVGTLNHFAKDLKIPLNIEEALLLIAEAPEIIKIDVGVCNGTIFLNNSGLGLYPEIVRTREKLQKDGVVKWFAFLVAVFRIIKNIPILKVKIKIGEDIIQKRTAFLFVGNNIYGLGGLSTGSRSSLCDGKLSLWISHRTSFFGLSTLLFHAIFGNVKEHRDFDAYEAKELLVETRRDHASVSFDGEVKVLASPLEYEIKTECLNVIVPLQEPKSS